MTFRTHPACFECRHLGERGDWPPTCVAFPERIPHAIYFGDFDHRDPYPGDHGVRWAPADGVPSYPPRPPRLRLVEPAGEPTGITPAAADETTS